MISQDHLIEGPCEFMGGNSSRNGTTLISLVTTGIVIVTSRYHMFKGLCELWREAPNMTNVAIDVVQAEI